MYGFLKTHISMIIFEDSSYILCAVWSQTQHKICNENFITLWFRWEIEKKGREYFWKDVTRINLKKKKTQKQTKKE